MDYFAKVAAIAIFGLSVAIIKSVHAVPFAELKRRARSGHSAAFYRLAARGHKTEWFLAALNVVVLSYAFMQVKTGWQFFVFLAVLAWILLASQSLMHLGFVASLVNKSAELLAGLFDRLPGMHAQSAHAEPHTRLFSKEDLAELLDRQGRQTDSRINEAELAMAIRTLNFSEQKVRDAMVPMAQAKLVQESDSIGPHLLSEMHGQGEGFLVVKAGPKSNQPKPIGILFLDDALKHAEGGKVRDAMKSGVEYIDEDLPLITALDEFLSRKQHFFAVTNSFEELVGTLSLRQVMEQIFGPKPVPKVETDDKLAANDQEDSVEPT